MPTFPVAQNTVGVAEMTGAKFQPADFGAAGEMVGRSLRGLGQQGSEVADQLFDRQRRVEAQLDDGAIKDQSNGILSFVNTSGFTGPDAFFYKKGREALTASGGFSSAIDDQVAKARSNLTNDTQRKLFDRAMVPQVLSWKNQIVAHAQKESATYDQGATAARAELAGNLGVNLWSRDPDHADQQISTGEAEIEHQGQLQGWAPEKIQLEKLAYTSSHYQDIGRSVAQLAGERAPAMIDAFLGKYGSLMTADARDAVATGARVQADHARAVREHKVEVAKRAVQVQQAEAKTRAESVDRNIKDGVNVPPAMLADALADAKTANDPGLTESLRQGSLKNNLTIRLAGATPAQLQDRVNTLNVRIGQAGGNVPADLLVERDHTQTLLTKSNSELAADPLSWGAEHLGINPGRLDLNDPASIQRRVQAALVVGKRTGAPPSPITSEEAASFAPIVTDGSMKQKAELVQRLASFGPLARTAVEKIAPQDAGFQALVGLAQLSNPAAARVLVGRVLTGREVLKTNPKLIDDTEANARFHEWIGPALTFLPTASTGALENAKAILASEAGANGKHQWADVASRWGVAINAALGGYTRQGVKVGGLGKINGAVTVLPDGMSQADFDITIARASGPSFVKASGNHTPTYADGSVPTATAIKKMVWVPVADGRYRMSDGHGFLTKRGGDPRKPFYEIDVRKLR